MAYSFRDYAPNQIFLLPPNPQEWLPQDHLAYHILDVVEELDMTHFLEAYSSDGRGAPAYSPRMLTAILLYGWCRHIYSSRKLEAICLEDVGARVIAAGHKPDHRSINHFRLRHGQALSDLFTQSVKLCQRAGIVSLVQVAIDGTKIKANASKRKAMSYKRMGEEEARLLAEIDAYFKRAQQEDAEEDLHFADEQGTPDIQAEIEHRKSRLAKIREAKASLQAEAIAAAAAKQEARAIKAAASSTPLTGTKPEGDVAPDPKAQRCFTDPQSRIMKGASGAFLQAYNAQASVDAEHQIIVACALTQEANDYGQLIPLVEQTLAQTGATPEVVLADPGYYSAANVAVMQSLDVAVLIPPDKERCGTPTDPAPPLSADALSALSPIEQMRHRVSTAEGRAVYSRRKVIVEPVFGQLKGSAGNPGYLGFLRRGLIKCTQEWHWLCAKHNILKYIRFQQAQRTPLSQTKRTRSSGRAHSIVFSTVAMEL